MSVYGAVDLHDAWGVDTVAAGVLTDEQLRFLAETPLPTPAGSQPCSFIWGYAPLSGNPGSHWDWSEERARAACDAGLIVLVVQHCRSGLWTASAHLGAADGQVAGEFCQKIGYPKDAHCALDDESVKNAGQPVSDHLFGWCSAVRVGALPCVYEGFAPGLTPSQEYLIPNVDRYFGAAGPWDVSTRGVCCRQFYPPIHHGGTYYDLDHAHPDKLGGVLRGMKKIA